MSFIKYFVSLFEYTVKKIRMYTYLSDQKGIINRYNREYNNWQAHLNNCKQFIVSNMNNNKMGKVAILGSGWLLDVPMNELINNFDEVWLFDIHHPAAIKHQYKHQYKVKFVCCDLTNGLIQTAIEAKHYTDFVEKLNNSKMFALPERFVQIYSVNILNQLDILLCDMLKKRFKISASQIIEIRKKIQQNHIDFLVEQKACLITDYQELHLLGDEIVSCTELIYANWPHYDNSDNWNWVFDTHKTYHAQFNITFHVKAISI